MMRLCCLSTSFARTFRAGEMDLHAYIHLSRDLGLDGVDLHQASFASTDKDYLKDIKLLCLKLGLSVACVDISNDFGKPEAELQTQIEMTKQWTDIAQFLGAPLVRVFAGWIRDGATREDVWQRTVGACKEVADYGGKVGVAVALQNHNHFNVTSVGADVLRLLDEVDHPYFSHVLDTGQYVDLYPSMEATAHRAVHVRAKIYEIETGEEKRLDYRRIFPILERVRYNGFVSIVFEGEEADTVAVPKAARYLRRFLLG